MFPVKRVFKAVNDHMNNVLQFFTFIFNWHGNNTYATDYYLTTIILFLDISVTYVPTKKSAFVFDGNNEEIR